MIKIYRKIGGNNGSSLLSIGAGVSQGVGTGGIEIKKVKLNGAYMEQYGIFQKRLIIPIIKKLIKQEEV